MFLCFDSFGIIMIIWLYTLYLSEWIRSAPSSYIIQIPVCCINCLRHVLKYRHLSWRCFWHSCELFIALLREISENKLWSGNGKIKFSGIWNQVNSNQYLISTCQRCLDSCLSACKMEAAGFLKLSPPTYRRYK